jgi:hypothetical protein
MDIKYRIYPSGSIQILDCIKVRRVMIRCQRGFVSKYLNKREYDICEYEEPEILEIELFNDTIVKVEFNNGVRECNYYHHYSDKYKNCVRVFFTIENKIETYKCPCPFNDGKHCGYDWSHGINIDAYSCDSHCNKVIKILDFWDPNDPERIKRKEYFRNHIWEELMRVFWNPKRKWTAWYLRLDN